MEHMDSVAIIEKNQRQKEAEQEAQAERERQEREEEERLNHDKVPDAARKLLEELTALYTELREQTGPDLKGHNPQVIEVPLPMPPAPKPSLWKRLFGSYEPAPRAPRKKVAVWWGIAAANTGDNWLHLHLGIDDGTVYGLLGITYIDTDEAYFSQLPYMVLQKLLKDVTREREFLHYEREARARE